MIFFLSKLPNYFISPVIWILTLLLAAMLIPRVRWRLRLLTAATALLTIFTNGAIINELLLVWELPPVPLKELKTQYDAGILLTGITQVGRSPQDRVSLNAGADRLTHTLWLYRAGYIKRIIISGGLAGSHGTPESEAFELATLLRLSGVPDYDIILEEQSRNTYENARYTKELLSQYPEIKSLVLITSAFHQRRAQGCFHKVGLYPIAFPAGFYSADRFLTLDYLLLPSSDALLTWNIFLHEILGFVSYKVLGYC
ncbi:YdcF family protein [Hymenobacter aerilatus]|uniref:YdcF family protein n=1 Tax=Hymenobacter aerilatus TaxID=2932251 RepID=A0A8T9T2A5_9BACT|nr:YdcF family protein [Hymenobacter aerilatus]UOR07314.1 YdcF family protein [Hymenobacter aerilatus]